MLVFKYFTQSRIILLLITAIVAWAGYHFFLGDGRGAFDNVGMFRRTYEPMSAGVTEAVPASVDSSSTITGDTVATAAVAENTYNRVDTVQPSDLLPSDVNSKWASENNISTLSGMRMPDLLTPEFMAGENSIGQSRKNSNLQLRADPEIPRIQAPLWNQSIIEPDRIKPVELDIGRSR